MAIQIIIQKKNPYHPCYLARNEDGSFEAGKTAETAHRFATAQEVFDYHRPRIGTYGHWAWNICNFVEEYIEQT